SPRPTSASQWERPGPTSPSRPPTSRSWATTSRDSRTRSASPDAPNGSCAGTSASRSDSRPSSSRSPRLASRRSGWPSSLTPARASSWSGTGYGRDGPETASTGRPAPRTRAGTGGTHAPGRRGSTLASVLRVPGTVASGDPRLEARVFRTEMDPNTRSSMRRLISFAGLAVLLAFATPAAAQRPVEFGIDAGAIFGLGDESSISITVPASRFRVGFPLGGRWYIEPVAGFSYNKVEGVDGVFTYNLELGALYHVTPFTVIREGR